MVSLIMIILVKKCVHMTQTIYVHSGTDLEYHNGPSSKFSRKFQIEIISDEIF